MRWYKRGWVGVASVPSNSSRLISSKKHTHMENISRNGKCKHYFHVIIAETETRSQKTDLLWSLESGRRNDVAKTKWIDFLQSIAYVIYEWLIMTVICMILNIYARQVLATMVRDCGGFVRKRSSQVQLFNQSKKISVANFKCYWIFNSFMAWLIYIAGCCSDKKSQHWL